MMGVSRAGFYKWKSRDSLVQQVHRDILVATIEQVHKDHRTHGYRWVAAFNSTKVAGNKSWAEMMSYQEESTTFHNDIEGAESTAYISLAFHAHLDS